MKRLAVGAAAVVLPWAFLVLLAAFQRLPAPLRDETRYEPSVRVLDRDALLLREVRAGDGCRARYVKLDEVGERAQRAVLAAEDRRFFSHPGVDPIAMLRAFGQALWHRRIVSGASTLTQQLARTVVARPRTLAGKIWEMALALRIEWTLSKEQILEQYLNRATFGPGLRGIEAASQFYFGKPTRDLSLAEAALLAGMPRGPSLYDPHKGTTRIVRRRDRVLTRLLSNGQATKEEVERAMNEPVVLADRPRSLGAPHFVRALLGGDLDPALPSGAHPSQIVTTLDAHLQQEAEVIAERTVSLLAYRHVTAASVIVLDNARGEILAYVGSPDFENRERLGQNDGVLARRQPGSALKPFVYELALEKLGFTAATVLPDVELHLQHDGVEYHPINYDGHFHGPVRVREALANSYNVPAVYTAEALGPGPVLARLHELGFGSLDRDASFYGPAIALGDGEVRLLDLANAYATLARDGAFLPVRAVRSVDGAPATRSDAPKKVIPPQQAHIIGDILSDPYARVSSFGTGSPLDLPFPVAVKTGTSKGFRDNWTVGYTREVTVAVWAGNFDGAPMQGVSGVAGAGPIFHDVMSAAHEAFVHDNDVAAAPELVSVMVCPLSGRRAGPACPHQHRESFVPGTEPRETCGMHEVVPIDRRNGLRASPECSARFVEERTFEIFPPEYSEWARASARPVAPDAYSPLCPRLQHANAGANVQPAAPARITYPLAGARFIYDDTASGPQVLTLRAVASSSFERVRFYVDGKPLAPSTRFGAAWPLSRGMHRVVVEGSGGATGEPVEFVVE